MVEAVKEDEDTRMFETSENFTNVDPLTPPSAFLEFSEIQDDEFYHISTIEPIRDVEMEEEKPELRNRGKLIIDKECYISTTEMKRQIESYYDTMSPEIYRPICISVQEDMNSHFETSTVRPTRKSGNVLTQMYQNSVSALKDHHSPTYWVTLTDPVTDVILVVHE